jgi:hypothetical protein
LINMILYKQFSMHGRWHEPLLDVENGDCKLNLIILSFDWHWCFWRVDDDVDTTRYLSVFMESLGFRVI